MKKTVFAVAAAMLALGAQAGTYTIDDFNSNLQDLSMVAGSPAGTVLTNTLGGRTLSITALTAVGATASTAISASAGDGFLSIANGSQRDSTVSVSWTLPSLTPTIIPTDATNLAFLFSVIQSDGNPTALAFTLNGASLANFAIPSNTANQDVAFNVDAAALAAGGTLALTIDGASGWDLTLDSFGLKWTDPVATQVPEPASLALVGLGLAALGARRRRNAA